MKVSPAVKWLKEPEEVQQNAITPLLWRIHFSVTMPDKPFSRQAVVQGKLFYLQFQRQQKFPLLPMDFHPSEPSPLSPLQRTAKPWSREELGNPCILPRTSQKWEGFEHWWVEWKHTESCSSQVESPVRITLTNFNRFAATLRSCFLVSNHFLVRSRTSPCCWCKKYRVEIETR